MLRFQFIVTPVLNNSLSINYLGYVWFPENTRKMNKKKRTEEENNFLMFGCHLKTGQGKKVLRKRWVKDFLPIFLMKKSQKSWKEGQKCISLIYFFLNSCFDKHTIELLYKFSCLSLLSFYVVFPQTFRNRT